MERTAAFELIIIKLKYWGNYVKYQKPLQYQYYIIFPQFTCSLQAGRIITINTDFRPVVNLVNTQISQPLNCSEKHTLRSRFPEYPDTPYYAYAYYGILNSIP